MKKNMHFERVAKYLEGLEKQGVKILINIMPRMHYPLIMV